MDRKVPFLDLRITDNGARRELLTAIEDVFIHGRIVMGPEVEALEGRLAAYSGRKYAVGVNSGTDALFLGLKSLGIGPGDEVITTSLSWIATANAIALTGATPVFADVRDDLNIDPFSVKRLITSRTKAIMPVHYTGKVCQMSQLTRLCMDHAIWLVEDSSQAFGASHFGRKSGSFGDLACFSMNPMKLFAACGEAGAILTDSEEIYDRLVSLRYNGTKNRELCVEVSLNGRLDTLQAAILLRRLDAVDEIVSKRREIAAWYSESLHDLVIVPVEQDGEQDVYYTYTIRTSRRDDLKQFLESRGVETKIQHPYLMPEQPAYAVNAQGEYGNAQRLVKQVLCIPAHEKLNQSDIQYVTSCIRDFFKSSQ